MVSENVIVFAHQGNKDIIMCVEYSQKVKKVEHPDKSSVKSAGNEEKYSTCMFSQKK